MGLMGRVRICVTPALNDNESHKTRFVIIFYFLVVTSFATPCSRQHSHEIVVRDVPRVGAQIVNLSHCSEMYSKIHFE